MLQVSEIVFDKLTTLAPSFPTDLELCPML